METSKVKRELGTRAWEVEWCVEIPLTESGDTDMDNAVYKRRIVATKEEALVVAKEVYPQDQWGAVAVTEVEFIDPYDDNIPQTFRWEYVSDSIHYSGEEGFDA